MRKPFTRPGLAGYAAAYREGTSPVEVVEATLAEIDASDRAALPLRAVIRRTIDRALEAAEAAEERYRRGKPASPLDGVPIVCKDNIDVAGVPTTNGTQIPFPLPTRDAAVIERLEAAGAVIVAKANQHEIGAGTSGINPHHGTPRNPHDERRWCGGSSSGSACAVGAGLVPLAVGTDAGGSVRTPAAFCGAVGLKPTFGRISRLGMSILCDTMDTIGPIATTCEDAGAALVAMGGRHEDDVETWDQPPLPLYAAVRASLRQSIRGTRVGLDRRLFDHDLVDRRVAAHVAEAADALRAAGAEIVDVHLPDPTESLAVGLVLIGVEGPSGLENVLEDNLALLGADIRLLVAIGRHFAAGDYLHAQRVRQRIRDAWRDVLADVDTVLMPAAGMPAGIIHDDALATGEIDQVSGEMSIANTIGSNLTGYPAVSVPCGRVDGVPVSAQIVAPPWHEARALRYARVIEEAGLFAQRRPMRYHDPLAIATGAGADGAVDEEAG